LDRLTELGIAILELAIILGYDKTTTNEFPSASACKVSYQLATVIDKELSSVLCLNILTYSITSIQQLGAYEYVMRGPS
jgi:hypothetical protein